MATNKLQALGPTMATNQLYHAKWWSSDQTVAANQFQATWLTMTANQLQDSDQNGNLPVVGL